MNEDFTIKIASVPDSDDVVAEIWKNDVMVAELRRATRDDLVLEIYPNVLDDPWVFDFQEWISALNMAREKLEVA